MHYVGRESTLGVFNGDQLPALLADSAYWIALHMLLDLPTTAELVSDIISTPVDPDQDIILDLWTGSGILGIAAYLSLLRNGRKGVIVGVEKDQNIAAKTNSIFWSIWIGHVVSWDSCDSATIRSLLAEYGGRIAWVINENLSQPGTRMHEEPFLHNLWNIYRSWYGLAKTQFAPYGIGITDCWSTLLGTDFLSPENNYALKLGELEFRHPSIQWHSLQSTSHSSAKKVWFRSLSGYLGYEAYSLISPDLRNRLPSRWIDYT